MKKKEGILNNERFGVVNRIIVFIGAKHKLFLCIVIGIQIVISVYFMINLRDNIFAPDSASYIEPALSFISQGRFLNGKGQPILTRTPGYPLLLAGIYRIFGYNQMPVIIFQIILGLLSSLALFDVISRWTKSKALGCIGTMFYILNISYYFHSTQILTDTVFSNFLIFAFYFFNRWLENRGMYRYIVASVCLINYALLIRPQLLYINFAIAILCVVLVLLKKLNWKVALIYILVYVTMIGGWSVRNAYYFGEVEFSPINKLNMLYYYAAGTCSISEEMEFSEAQKYVDEILREKCPEFDMLSPMEQYNAEQSVGVQIIREHFGAFVLLAFRGLFMLLFGPGLTLLGNLGVPKALYLLLAVGTAGMAFVLYVIYAYGFLRNIGKVSALDWAVLVFNLYMMASGCLVGYSRFRLPVYPFCIIGAMRVLSIMIKNKSYLQKKALMEEGK